MELVIRVEADDPSDIDWVRGRAVAAVEDVIEENKEEGRFDGSVEVSWEIKDEG